MSQYAADIAAGTVVVLYLDECHLVWGDACGYAWGPRGQRIEVPIINQRERQTYYGALNPVSGDALVIPVDAGNTDWTLIFLQYLRDTLPEKRLIVCWDGASYHRSDAIRLYLESVNHGYPDTQWPLTCVQFAPHAPEQNPIEDMWLQAKSYVRKHWSRCQATFASVTTLFEEAITTCVLNYEKLRMYLPGSDLN